MADPVFFVVSIFVGLRFRWLLAVTLLRRRRGGGGRKKMTAVVLIILSWSVGLVCLLASSRRGERGSRSDAVC